MKWFWIGVFPQTVFALRGSDGFSKDRGRRPGVSSRSSLTHFDQKNLYLVTLALVSSRRNTRLRAQTSIFKIENHHFLVQMTPPASWPRDMPADSLESGNPGFGPPLGLRSKNQGFRTAWLTKGQSCVKHFQIEFVRINFSRSIFPYMSTKHESGRKWRFGFGNCSIFQTPFFAGV